MSAQSTWNFCPYCGHRIFQHNGEGCTHTEMLESYVHVVNEEGKPENRRVTEEVLPCDCKQPHPLIAQAGA